MIRLDLDVVQGAADDAGAVASDFASSDTSASSASDSCGHDGLAGVIDDFASKWDRRRGEFAENLTTVSEALEAISTSFRELDATFAESVEIDESVV